MEIDTTQPFAPQLNSETVTMRSSPDDKFSSFLEADLLALKTKSDRDDVLAHQQPSKKDGNNDDVEFIKANGMSAYVEEVHKLKLEEMRAKILEMMGLTEEDMAGMSTEERQLIEKSIAQEIQHRLAAVSISNSDPQVEDATNSNNLATTLSSQNMLAAQILVADPGSLIGMVISDAEQDSNDLKQNSPADHNSAKDDNDNG